MSVVPLFKNDKRENSNLLYKARKRYGLTLLEAAKALGTSPTTLEREESRPSPTLDPRTAASRFENFVAAEKDGARNLLFGALPLRVARDMLGLSVEEIAARYGLSPGHWRKLECHARELAPEMRSLLERDVRQSFEKICEWA